MDAPHNGTATSMAAAEQAELFSLNLRELVFRAIKQSGDRGLTDHEIQARLGLSGDTQRPRRYELHKQGLIKPADETRRAPSGRQATVWIVA